MYESVLDSYNLIPYVILKIMPSCMVFVFVYCLFRLALTVIKRVYEGDYSYSDSLSNDNNEMLSDNMNETPEVILEQAAASEDVSKKALPKKIRHGGVCPYCLGVLTRVYSKKDKLKNVYCEYCVQTIDT